MANWLRPRACGMDQSDAEGAGEMFRVTTLPIDGTAPRNEDNSINFKEDFFGRSTNLTVSG